MSDVNRLIIAGRLTRNAETKTTTSGLFIASFAIANNRNKKDAEEKWIEVPSFFSFSLYGKKAQGLAPFLLQGQMVLIEGHLEQRSWEQDSTKRYRMELIIDDINLLGGKAKDKTCANTTAEPVDKIAEKDDDLYTGDSIPPELMC